VKCSHAREWFSDYLDGQPVPPYARFWVRLHFAICPLCRRVRRSMDAVEQSLHALKEAPPPGSPSGKSA
jgi:predicted anti-sigma-YlaC factor YlaD